MKLKKLNIGKIVTIILLLIFTESRSQTIKVVSENGVAIPQVLVIGENITTVTDKKGEFSLSSFLNDYSLILKHTAFNVDTVEVKYLRARGIVVLKKRTFVTKEVKVFAGKENLSKEIVKITPATKSSYNNVAEIIELTTSIKINSYGGKGSLQTVSARGMSSNNTLVLFNESKVNDLRSGSFDFSLLGINSVEKIEYYKNGTEGYSSAGGVLKLTSGDLPTSNKFLLGIKNDNLQGKDIYLSSGLVNKNNSLIINFERSYSSNHYTYKFEGETKERKNADYSKTFFSTTFNHLMKKGFIKLYAHFNTMNNGLPGFIASNNYTSSHARSFSRSILAISNGFYEISKNFGFRSSLSFHNQKFNIFDPFNELFFSRKEDETFLNEFQFNNIFSFSEKSTEVELGAHLNYGEMSVNKNALNIAEQNSASRIYGNVFTSLSKEIPSNTIFTSIKLSFSGSYSISHEVFNNGTTDYNYFSYKLGFTLAPTILKNLTVETYFAKNIREPNFTEIYYAGLFGGNKLLPEKFSTINFSLDYHFSSLLNSSLTFYVISGKDKIVWLPTRLALQIPRNFRSVESRGLELFINSTIVPKRLLWKIIYTYNSAINTYFAGEGDNSYLKQLVYTPKNRLTFSSTLQIEKFASTLNFSFTDKSYFTGDNNPRFTLPAYLLFDLSLSYKFSLLKYDSRITLNIYNLLNENYFVIQSYPMPLRSFVVDFQFGVF